MQIVVIHDTKFGNTVKIAEAVGRGVGTLADVRVMSIAEAVGVDQTFAERPDLLFLGGPTQKRAPSPALRAFIDALPTSLRGIPAASFDTRYRGAIWLMGSAAVEAAKALRKARGELVAPPESFFVARRGPLELQNLEPGEIERAEQWGRTAAAAAIAH